MTFCNDFLNKSKGKKGTWANPMGSKLLKSWYEIDSFTFQFVYVLFSFFCKSMNNHDFRGPLGKALVMVFVIFNEFQDDFYHSVDLVRSIWQGPCKGFGDFQGRPEEEATALIGVSNLDA